MQTPLNTLKESSSAAKITVDAIVKEHPDDQRYVKLQTDIDLIASASAALGLLHPDAVNQVAELDTNLADVQDKVDDQTGKLDTVKVDYEHERAEKWKWILITVGVVGLTVTFFVFRSALKVYLPFLP
jgi:hypothetical protein